MADLLEPQTSKQLLQKKKDLALARSSFLGSFLVIHAT